MNASIAQLLVSLHLCCQSLVQSCRTLYIVCFSGEITAKEIGMLR